MEDRDPITFCPECNSIDTTVLNGRGVCLTCRLNMPIKLAIVGVEYPKRETPVVPEEILKVVKNG